MHISHDVGVCVCIIYMSFLMSIDLHKYRELDLYIFIQSDQYIYGRRPLYIFIQSDQYIYGRRPLYM